MPSVLFLCPHCEKHAEVQVTSVTRSRPCPHCGENVMLQAGARETKRRALLVHAPEIAESVIDKPLMPAYEPQVIEGEVFERLKMDPEVRAFRNKLLVGLATSAVLIAVAVVVDAWLKSPTETTTAVSTTAPALPVTELTMQDSRMPSGAAGRSEAAQAVARKFLAAKSAAECLEVMNDATYWEPAVKRYVLTKPLKPLPVMSMSVGDAVSSSGNSVVVRAELLGAGETELHVVWKHERPLIDWPSYVGWSPRDWAEVMQQASREPVSLRVLVEMAENYTNDFSDAGSLLCLKLSDPIKPDSPPLFAYAPHDSTEAEEIMFLLKNQSGSSKLTLAIRYPTDPVSRDQVWIDKVLSLNWFYTSL